MGDRLVFQASLGGAILIGFSLQSISIIKKKEVLKGGEGRGRGRAREKEERQEKKEEREIRT